MDVEGFSELSWEPLVLSHLDLGVIHGVTVTGGRGVFHDGRVGMSSISMFAEPSAPPHTTRILQLLSHDPEVM